MSKHSKSIIMIPVGLLAVGSIIHLASSAPSSYDSNGTRFLRADALTSTTFPSSMITALGAGPELTGLNGHAFKLQDDGGTTLSQRPGVHWYNVLESDRFQWNMAPHRWHTCPHDEDKFMGDTTFAFHEPHPLYPDDETKRVSKYLQFHVTRRDERNCLWNNSNACLAGGSFVMNFGKTARDVLHPGEYSLKTASSEIKIVAYNTNRHCSRSVNGDGDILPEDNAKDYDAPHQDAFSPKTPLDYLRRDISQTMNPTLCQEWIDERDASNDLFLYNSDLATVHVSSPWMKITVQVRQNKVKTDEKCVYAGMNVWISEISSNVLDGGSYAGLIKDDDSKSFLSSHILETLTSKKRALNYGDAARYEIDGPFGVDRI